MKNLITAFITILKIELQDLEGDIEMLITESEARKKNEEISNYVYMENLTLLKKELLGVNALLSRLNKMKPADFGSPGEVSSYLLDDLKDRIDRKLLPPVLLFLVERKFNKVLKYLNQ